MFNLSTIKGKLTVLMALSFISYAIIGYLAYSNNKDANKTTERMLLIGDIRAHTNGAMMEIRGYQLLYIDEFVTRYNERNQKLDETIDALLKITRAKDNKDRLNRIKEHHQAWVKLNEPRIKIISENENLIHDPEFVNSPEGKILQKITKESAEMFEKMRTEQLDLITEMKKRNLATLDSNALIIEIILLASAVLMMGIFYFILQNITHSIARL